MRKAVLVILSFTMISLVAPNVFAEPGKYGYVDVAKVFDGYQKTKDQDKTLQDAGKKKEEERDALVYDIRQLKDELVLMSGDNKNKKQELLEKKVQALQSFDQDAKKGLADARGNVVREIFGDIDTEIKKFAAQNGFEMLFNEKALLFHNDKMDVTQPVLESLNKSYKPKKK